MNIILKPTHLQKNHLGSLVSEAYLIGATARKDIDHIFSVPSEKMTGELWLSMPLKEQYDYVSHQYGLENASLKEVEKKRFSCTQKYIQKLPIDQQRQYLHDIGLIPDSRELDFLVKTIPGLGQEILNLPKNAIVVDLGAGKCIAIGEIAQLFPENNLQAYGIDIVQPISVPQDVQYIQADLNDGLPDTLPYNCNLIYSMRIIQYVKELRKLLESTYEHLAVGGKAILHIGRQSSFSDDVLHHLQEILAQQGHSCDIIQEEVFVLGNTTTMGSVYITLTKTEDPCIIPDIQSALPQNMYISTPHGHKYYNRGMIGEDITSVISYTY